MRTLSALLLLVATGSILTGCGSLKHRATPDNPPQKDYSSTYHITLEREVLVNLNDPDSESDIQKLSETLRMVCHIQSIFHSDGGYRLEFKEIDASRMDFLHEVALNDPVDELAGQSFEIHIDEEGQIIKADTFVEALKTLARGCETCPQDHDCGRRTVREQTFLLDVWAIQELIFRASKASQNLAQTDEWTYTRQLPSVLPGEMPYVTTAWEMNENQAGIQAAIAYETLTSDTVQNAIPQLFHPHIRPKGLLGYLRNCTYDSINGQVTLEAEVGIDLPVQLTREAVMNAAAFYTLSRLPQRPSITVWETLNVRQSPVLSSAKIHLTAKVSDL